MSAPPARGYLGISEVLAQLRAEFPDISVSKIRFLETEGLIAPARSPAGYRRFCGQDLDRLRFVLTAQRDQYLPLRVIRERLARLDQLSADPAGNQTGDTSNGWSSQAIVPGDTRARGLTGETVGWRGSGDRRGSAPDRAGALAGQSVSSHPQVSQTRPGRGLPGTPQASPALASQAPAGQSVAGRALPGHGAARQAAGQATGAGSEGMLSRRELVEAAGISEALLTELETFGLLRRVGRHYGPDAAEVARTAVALTSFGVEARHLRAVRAAAERESTMIESLVAPILRQRGSGARELAGRTARDCALLVLRLHRALVEGALAEAGLAEPGLPQAGLAGASRSGAGRDRAVQAADELAGQDSDRHNARGVGGASA
jgi:DNA-binding transcriptional MerR regulator